MRSRTSRTGIAVTLGNAATTAFCRAGSTVAGTRVVATHVAGAPASAAGESTKKKFVVRLCQSTRRTLVTSTSTGTPCTSNVRREPGRTPSSRAAVSSTDARARPAPSAAVHQRPAVSVLPAGGASPNVSA